MQRTVIRSALPILIPLLLALAFAIAFFAYQQFIELDAAQTIASDSGGGPAFELVSYPDAVQIIHEGQLAHASFGFHFIELTPAIAAQLGITQTQGLAVRQVPAESAAGRAGLASGDVITAVDGRALEGDFTAHWVLTTHEPGDKITLTVLRNGQTVYVPLVLAKGS